MSERPVELTVSKKLREKVKKMKGSLTYEEFINNLIEKEKSVRDTPNSLTQSKPPKTTKSRSDS